jgi:hypothetical protein
VVYVAQYIEGKEASMLNNEMKLRIIKIFLWVVGIFLLFWWPLSHWFYSNFYHQLLGFKIGSYQDNMVKIIGTTGIIPVLLMIFSALDPLRNRHMIITLIVFSFSIALTYVFLITTDQFPKREYINVALSVFLGTFLLVFFPWKEKNNE